MQLNYKNGPHVISRVRKITLICPLWPLSITRRRIKNGKARITSELGREVFCVKCEEYWPADTEFFSSVPSQKTGLYPWCKACFEKLGRKRKAKKVQT